MRLDETIGYASRTGTRASLDVLQAADWRLFCTPGNIPTYGTKPPKWTDGTPAPYALDNGAWTAFQQDQPFPSDLFLRAVELLGPTADFVVVPDIVEGGLESLEFSRSWLPKLHGACKMLLIALQDGMEIHHVEDLVGPDVGIFLGGSTEYKLGTLQKWGVWARNRGLYYHVGRVNSRRRIRLCALAGAHSFDGTNATMFAKVKVPSLDAERRQGVLWLPPKET